MADGTQTVGTRAAQFAVGTAAKYPGASIGPASVLGPRAPLTEEDYVRLPSEDGALTAHPKPGEPGPVRAQDLATRPDTMVFINGIMNQIEAHMASAAKLARSTNRPVLGIYNKTGLSGRWTSFLAGLATDLRQSIDDEAGNPSNKATQTLLRTLATRSNKGRIVAHSQGSLIAASALWTMAWKGDALGGIVADFYGSQVAVAPKGPNYKVFIGSDDSVAALPRLFFKASRLSQSLRSTPGKSYRPPMAGDPKYADLDAVTHLVWGNAHDFEAYLDAAPPEPDRGLDPHRSWIEGLFTNLYIDTVSADPRSLAGFYLKKGLESGIGFVWRKTNDLWRVTKRAAAAVGHVAVSAAHWTGDLIQKVGSFVARTAKRSATWAVATSREIVHGAVSGVRALGHAAAWGWRAADHALRTGVAAIDREGVTSWNWTKRQVERTGSWIGNKLLPSVTETQVSGKRAFQDGDMTGPFLPKEMGDKDRARFGLSPLSALAQGAAVFVNGVHYSAEKHCHSAQRLADELGVVVVGVWNATGVGHHGLGFSRDWFQSLGDKMNDVGHNPATHTLKGLIARYGDARKGDGGLRILAHSQGSIIVSEALRQARNEGVDIRNEDVTTFGNAIYTVPKGPTYRHYVFSGDIIANSVGSIGVGSGELATGAELAGMRATSRDTRVMRHPSWNPVRQHGLDEGDGMPDYIGTTAGTVRNAWAAKARWKGRGGFSGIPTKGAHLPAEPFFSPYMAYRKVPLLPAVPVGGGGKTLSKRISGWLPISLGHGDEPDRSARDGGSVGSPPRASATSPRVQRKGIGGGPEGDARTLLGHLLSAGGVGAPVAGGVRERLGPTLGFDPGGARVHTGPVAASAARALGAEAFTVGSHVFFGAGRHDPASPKGMGLLAHELAHVGQQTGGVAGLESAAGMTGLEAAARSIGEVVEHGLAEDRAASIGHCQVDVSFDGVPLDDQSRRIDALSDHAVEEATRRLTTLRLASVRLDALEVDVELDLDRMSDEACVDRWADAIVRAARAHVRPAKAHVPGLHRMESKSPEPDHGSEPFGHGGTNDVPGISSSNRGFLVQRSPLDPAAARQDAMRRAAEASERAHNGVELGSQPSTREFNVAWANAKKQLGDAGEAAAQSHLESRGEHAINFNALKSNSELIDLVSDRGIYSVKANNAAGQMFLDSAKPSLGRTASNQLRSLTVSSSKSRALAEAMVKNRSRLIAEGHWPANLPPGADAAQIERYVRAESRLLIPADQVAKVQAFVRKEAASNPRKFGLDPNVELESQIAKLATRVESLGLTEVELERAAFPKRFPAPNPLAAEKAKPVGEHPSFSQIEAHGEPVGGQTVEAAEALARLRGMGKLAKVVRYGGRVLLVVAVAADAYEIYTAEDKMEATAGVAGGWAGATAAAGAVGVGLSWFEFAPGPGTVAHIAVTGVAGVVGYFGGKAAGKAVYRLALTEKPYRVAKEPHS